ncbi:MAG: DUF58 domain-containing protein [Gammaproteobacteria bacterium]
MIDALRRRKPVASPTAPHDTPTAGDGVVRVSVASLLALHRGSASLAVKPRQVRAITSGGYLSPFKGRGMEFDEVRPYMQGDDVRSIDWRVTARSGKPHTKLFREERERAVLLWIDLRDAMFFATRGAFKAVRAAQAAALLGWSTLHHGDRLGALIFDEQHHDELRPKRGQPPLMHVLRRLAAHPAWLKPARGGGEPAAVTYQSLLRLRRVAQPGSLIILLSDFSGFDAQVAAQVAQFTRHNDVILINVYDPLDADLPPAGRYRVSDGRRIINVESGDAQRRERYRRRFAERQEALQHLCRAHGITMLSLSTADEPLAVLQRGLGTRR